MLFFQTFSRLVVFSSFASLACATGPVQVSFNSPVEIPEAVLKAGSYTFELDDHLADRAVVKVTESNGAQHFLLSVPSGTLPRSKGLIYFPAGADTKVLHGWECPGCSKPLEFVYPKDEAIKLTAETGKSVLAFDATYDKLPANLSPEDRKVVTLWLLSPQRVSAGRGVGLTAAKYSADASTQTLPKQMPKTASDLFLELSLGSLLLTGALALQLFRKRQPTVPIR